MLSDLRNGTWLDKQEFPELRFAVPGILPEGFSLIVAPPKAGKSWLVLGFLLALAAGGLALGRLQIRQSGPVLYLALEDGDRRMQSRVRTLLGDDEPIPEQFHYLTKVQPGTVLLVIEEFLQLHPTTRLVVLDTLGKVMPPAAGGESAYARDYRVAGALKAVADRHPGLSIAAVHHDRKAASEDFVDSVSGTHGLAGAADAILVLQRARQSKDGLLMVTGRDVPEESYALQLDGIGAWQLDGEDLKTASGKVWDRSNVVRLSDSSADILKYVRDAGEAGVRAKDVVDKFGESAQQTLKRRVQDGLLIKAGRGLYKVPSTPVSEQSEVSDSQANGLFESDTEPDTDDPLSAGPQLEQTYGHCRVCGSLIEPLRWANGKDTCAKDYQR